MDMSERVARGAEWLDHNRPGWALEIDVGTLEMEQCTLCVLGQIFGDYWMGLSFISDVNQYDQRLIRENDQRLIGESRDMGFTLGEWPWFPPRDDSQWDDLAQKWITAIKDRLDAGVML